MRVQQWLILGLLVGCMSTTGSPPATTATNPAPAVTPTETPPPPATGLPEDSACLGASECESGICEGQGCTPDEPGHCASKQRGCTRDRRAYCGCNGQTFFASGSCPAQRYKARQACAGS